MVVTVTALDLSQQVLVPLEELSTIPKVPLRAHRFLFPGLPPATPGKEQEALLSLRKQIFAQLGNPSSLGGTCIKLDNNFRCVHIFLSDGSLLVKARKLDLKWQGETLRHGGQGGFVPVDHFTIDLMFVPQSALLMGLANDVLQCMEGLVTFQGVTARYRGPQSDSGCVTIEAAFKSKRLHIGRLPKSIKSQGRVHELTYKGGEMVCNTCKSQHHSSDLPLCTFCDTEGHCLHRCYMKTGK